MSNLFYAVWKKSWLRNQKKEISSSCKKHCFLKKVLAMAKVYPVKQFDKNVPFKNALTINNNFKNLSQSLFRFVSITISLWALYLCADLKITLTCFPNNWLVIYNATTRWCTLVIAMELCVICSEAWFQDIYLCLHSCGCFGHNVV